MFIENKYISITTESLGGEIHSIKSKATGNEYLWNADPKHWGYSAPILFPIIGRILNGVYRVEGKEYSLPSHGFGRLKTYEIAEKTDTLITYRLSHDEETLSSYPFKFILEITYELIDNSVKITYSVTNDDDKPIYFQLGAHTAIACPFINGESFEDYFLEFEEKETIGIMEVDEKCFFTHRFIEYLNNENIINLTYDVFKNDALVFEGLKSKNIKIKSKKSNEYVNFKYDGFPILALWTKKDAPFICIEPWSSHADYNDFNGNIKDKHLITKLEQNKKTSLTHIIEIYED